MLDIAVWTVIAVIIIGLLAFSSVLFDEFSPFVGCLYLVGVIAASLIACMAFYDAVYNDHPSITLLKSEFVCSASHDEPITTYVQVGKVMVPNTIHDKVCDVYTRRP